MRMAQSMSLLSMFPASPHAGMGAGTCISKIFVAYVQVLYYLFARRRALQISILAITHISHELMCACLLLFAHANTLDAR